MLNNNIKKNIMYGILSKENNIPSPIKLINKNNKIFLFTKFVNKIPMIDIIKNFCI